MDGKNNLLSYYMWCWRPINWSKKLFLSLILTLLHVSTLIYIMRWTILSTDVMLLTLFVIKWCLMLFIVWWCIVRWCNFHHYCSVLKCNVFSVMFCDIMYCHGQQCKSTDVTTVILISFHDLLFFLSCSLLWYSRVIIYYKYQLFSHTNFCFVLFYFALFYVLFSKWS